jgi:hypothetical protein
MAGKKGEKKARDASLTYAAIILATIGFGLCGGAVALPLWIFFPPNAFLGWAPRNMGLMKLSTRFTNTMLTSADTSWMYVKNQVCSTAMARIAAVGSSAVGMASAMVSDLAGANCPAPCQENLMLRCKQYKLFSVLGLGVAGCVAGGTLMTLTGALLPLLGKERTKDKWSNFTVMLVGALLACAGVGGFFFYQQMMFDNIRASSWYPDQSIGVSFMMAGAGAAVSLIATIPQYLKLDKSDKNDDKRKSSISVEAPIALDPSLL